MQEITRFLNEEIDQKELKSQINIKTRQYAKRQKTWSRAYMGDWQFVYSSNLSILQKKILNLVT